jgi:hypothetical protein
MKILAQLRVLRIRAVNRCEHDAPVVIGIILTMDTASSSLPDRLKRLRVGAPGRIEHNESDVSGFHGLKEVREVGAELEGPMGVWVMLVGAGEMGTIRGGVGGAVVEVVDGGVSEVEGVAVNGGFGDATRDVKGGEASGVGEVEGSQLAGDPGHAHIELQAKICILGPSSVKPNGGVYRRRQKAP